MDQKFSQEFLNAFVDDQLTADEKSRAYPLINQDESLNRTVCELRKTRDLVQLAYRHVPPAPMRNRPVRRPGYLGVSLAAGVALAIGVSIGWVLHRPTINAAPAAISATQKTAPRTVAALPEVGDLPARRPTPALASAPAPKTGQAAPAKVLIHVNDGDAARLGRALDEIEQLVQYYRASNQNSRVEVIINGEGLALVRSDVSPHAARVERMQQEYDNLAFVACQNTIDRLKREKGITAQLLPGVVVIDSGVAQLMRRQHQGWAYIQV